MVEIESGIATVAANSYATLHSFRCPKGEEIEILATGYLIPSSGWISEFAGQRAVGKLFYNVAPDENHMVPRSIILKEGEWYKAIGQDSSGANNAMGVVIVIDRRVITS